MPPAGCRERQHGGHIPNRGLNSKTAVIIDPGPSLPNCVSPALCGRGAESRAGAAPRGLCVALGCSRGTAGAVVRNTCPEATYWMAWLWENYLNSLCLSFPICEMGVAADDSIHLTGVLSRLIHLQCVEQCVGPSRGQTGLCRHHYCFIYQRSE